MYYVVIGIVSYRLPYMQVLSNSVAKALELEGRPDTKETARFCHIFNKFFDILNVRSLDECVRQRKPDMRPFRQKSDPRLQVLH